MGGEKNVYYPIKIKITPLFQKQGGNYPIDQNFICSSDVILLLKYICIYRRNISENTKFSINSDMDFWFIGLW